MLLTIVVNNISLVHQNFSSSLLGAILLGITTSLPEVITFYTLVILDNYDLAILNIIGSNLFNLLVLGVSDIFFRQYPIYIFSDANTFLILKIGVFITIICMIKTIKKPIFNKFLYIISSIIVVLSYLLFWFINFLN